MDLHSFPTRTIIATRGLPHTWKTEVATFVAGWVNCPILCIDDIPEGLHPHGSEVGGCEIERLYHHAFDALCHMAARQLAADGNRKWFKCVIIKSRLYSTYELDWLMQLAQAPSSYTVLIIECLPASEHRWRERFNISTSYRPYWYRPKNWHEVERFRCDYDARGWDHHFSRSINELPDDNVRRLALDPFYDPWNIFEGGLISALTDAIVFLTSCDELRSQVSTTVTFLEPGQFLMEEKLKGPGLGASLYLCDKEKGCYIKYVTEDCKDRYCGACDKKIDSGVGYACHVCSLALHKSCAVLKAGKFHTSCYDNSGQYHFPETYVCKLCRDNGKDFSYECNPCVFETHLKCRRMPTIVHHGAHPKHFLSIMLTPPTSEQYYYCWGCGDWSDSCRYVCRIYSITYHLGCIALAKEVKHKHGGYKHHMELKYTLDGMEDFWCDVCHEDMDPQLWFYLCKECPYYIAHMDRWRCRPCKAPLYIDVL